MRILLLTLLLAGSAAAQDKPLFSSTTHMVVETVNVTDQQGKPVIGLTAKDFTVTEDGKPQTVVFAEYQKLPETAAPPAAFTAHVAPVSHMQRTRIQPEKSGDVRYRDRRLLAMYFDKSAMPPQDQARALAAAQRFIRTQMTPSDLVAILTYSGGAVEVLDDFTENRAKLLETIQTLLVGEEIDYSIRKDTDAAFGQNDAEFNLFNTDRQLSALQTAAIMLSVLSEKKSLLYFASGLRLNGVDNQAQLHATENAAVRAGVAFWPIDARGLVTMPPLGDATQASPGGVAVYNGVTQGSLSNGFYASQDTLYALGADTGGKALLDNNDLAQGILNAQKAISSYYVIGYYSSNAALDGKLRRIKISVPGAGLSLDYRQAYYAGKEFTKFTSVDKERQLEDALMLGDPITELTIALEVNYFQLNRAEYYVPIAVKIPGSELARARKGGAERTLIDFVGEIKEGGVTVANLRDKVDLKLTGETAAELSKRPITYDAGFTLLPGTYTLKFLARDAETGRIGTFLRTFVIPNLVKEQRYQPISSVVLSSQEVEMQDALFNAKDKLHAQNLSPLVQDGRKLIPSVTRVFSRAKPMYAYMQAYGTQQPVAALVAFYQNGRKIWETEPAASNGKSLRLNLTLDKLPEGEYLCQVTVLNPADQKAAFWQGQIMVIP